MQVVSSDGFYNCQDENSFPRAQAGKSTGGSWGSFGLPPAMVEPSFSIHVDSEPAPCQTKVYKENASSEPPLSHLVTSLQVERRPLECVFTSLNESGKIYFYFLLLAMRRWVGHAPPQKKKWGGIGKECLH